MVQACIIKGSESAVLYITSDHMLSMHGKDTLLFETASFHNHIDAPGVIIPDGLRQVSVQL